MPMRDENNMAKQSNNSVIVMMFDDYWLVNGIRLQRQYINEDEQIRLLKSILARESIQDVNKNIEFSIRFNKKKQIQLLKSMLIQRAYGFPKISINVVELPNDLKGNFGSFESAVNGYLKLKIEKNTDEYNETYENESGDQFEIGNQVFPMIKEENSENSY